MIDLIESTSMFEFGFHNGWRIQGYYETGYGTYKVSIVNPVKRFHDVWSLQGVTSDEAAQLVRMLQIADTATTDAIMQQMARFREEKGRKVPQEIMAADMLKGNWSATE
jgi:hypothetical protein